MAAPDVDTLRHAAPGRITRSREFREVLATGHRRQGRRLLLYVRPGAGPARAGFVCGRSVGGAVARNRARRILREAWRSMAPTLKPGTRVVLVARPGIEGAAMQDVAAELRTLLVAEGQR